MWRSSELMAQTRLPVVNAVNQFSFELFLSFKGRQVSSAVNSSADHHGIKYFRCSVARRVFHLPRYHRPATSVILPLFHRHHFRLKPDVLLQPEVIDVQAEVLEKLGMTHVVGEVGRHQKVAVARQFLRRNGHCRPTKDTSNSTIAYCWRVQCKTIRITSLDK